ncbi:uncharacterized protein LOC115633551 [Scaptodrosophila lebanonensis]|uniref:Uncharacterized protein LOC115633321 n=1 Tax=Drosophila lebanonensis TaxID=7225 RepID=A0A6J2UDQ9_DROLE|nr:uncharacterized protein LOC115633321 [Scaptodrosophila lebanonensis]XP_030386867.1 uncharacterized protein LOC115633550 [Scaptodrosophila lebanonensis]XP_030386868.1 uncharacterized protein LOC115633551 [Scaptodrosophila lebanonensis]
MMVPDTEDMQHTKHEQSQKVAEMDLEEETRRPVLRAEAPDETMFGLWTRRRFGKEKMAAYFLCSVMDTPGVVSGAESKAPSTGPHQVAQEFPKRDESKEG